jgi:hypothetical protein
MHCPRASIAEIRSMLRGIYCCMPDAAPRKKISVDDPVQPRHF